MMSTRLSHLKKTERSVRRPFKQLHASQVLCRSVPQTSGTSHICAHRTTSLRLDGVSAEGEGKLTLSFTKHANKKQCMYFRNVLCRLKPQLPSEDCNIKAFCPFNAEAQARHSDSTARRCLWSSTRIHIGVFFGTPGIPITANSQNQSRRVLVTLSPHGNLQALHRAYVLP